MKLNISNKWVVIATIYVLINSDGFFHASGGRGRLASSLGSKLFSGSLSSSGFAISLLNTSHLFNLCGKPTLIFLRTKITSSKASCLCFSFKSFYVKFSFFLRDFFFLGFLKCSISSGVT